MKDTSPIVSVIIVTWNSTNDIQACLSSVMAQNYTNFRVLVVDNQSVDDTLKVVDTNFLKVETILAPSNLYYTGGNNLGIAHVQETIHPKYIFLLNPDTIVPANWLSAQVAVFESNDKIGVVGPKILFAPGFGPSTDKLSTPEQSYINSVGMEPGGFLFPYDRGFGEIDNGQYAENEEVFAISGTSLGLRSSMLEEVGNFYEKYQMYLEDVDLCVRAAKAGWQIVFTPRTFVWHKYMQSTSKSGQDRYEFWSTRNYLIYTHRNFGLKKFLRAVWQSFKSHNLLLFTRCFFSFLKSL